MQWIAILKRNDNRWPAGTPGGKGGEFAPKNGAGGGNSVPKKDISEYVSGDATPALNAEGIRALRGMTDAERELVRGYTTNDHYRINTGAKKLAKGQAAGSVVAGMIKNLDKIINRTELTENRVLFRGLEEYSQTALRLMDGIESDLLRRGSVIEFPAYLSTSLDESVGKRFRDRVMLTIRAKKGQKALFVGGTDISAQKTEAEVLLPRKTKMILRGVDIHEARTWNGGTEKYYNIHLDIV